MTSISGYGIRWDPREPFPPELSDEPGRPPESINVPRPPNHLRTLIALPVVTPEVSLALPSKPLSRSGYLSPVAVTIKGQILSDLATVTVHQTFENDSDQATPEAHYTFPLPDDCTVTGFSARVGNAAVLRAKVKPKAEAKQDFKTAVQENRFTALLEQHTTEVFTASLGNIPARTRIKTEISYTFTLSAVFSAEEAVQTFLVPTSIGPRYGTAPSTDVNNPDHPDRFSLELDIFDAQDTKIRSGTHKISVELHNESEQALTFEDLAQANSVSREITNTRGSHQVARVRTQDCNTFRDTDLEIKIYRSTATRPVEPIAWLEKHPVLKDQYAMMLELPPSAHITHSPQSCPVGELIFLADRSGSMVDKMDSLRLALRYFLKGLPLGWKFNIWSFGSTYQSMWPESQIYDAATLAEALAYIDNGFRSNLGGTELLSALRAVVSSRSPTISPAKARCEVMIITDGEVWRLQETLDFVEGARRLSSYSMRFFALGIGRHVSAALVNGIARCGGGYSEIIPTAGDGDHWQGRAVTMLTTALSAPARHKVTLQLAEGTIVQAQSPRDLIATSNPFSSQRVFLLFTAAKAGPATQTISIKLQVVNGHVHDRQFTIAAGTLPTEPGTLHALAARAYLTECSSPKHDEVASSANTGHDRPAALPPQELACRFSLLSQWTSLVLEAGKQTQALHDLDLADPSCKSHTINDVFGGGISSRVCTILVARGVSTRDIPPGITSYRSRPHRHREDSLHRLDTNCSIVSPYLSHPQQQMQVPPFGPAPPRQQACRYPPAPSYPEVFTNTAERCALTPPRGDPSHLLPDRKRMPVPPTGQSFIPSTYTSYRRISKAKIITPSESSQKTGHNRDEPRSDCLSHSAHNKHTEPTSTTMEAASFAKRCMSKDATPYEDDGESPSTPPSEQPAEEQGLSNTPFVPWPKPRLEDNGGLPLAYPTREDQTKPYASSMGNSFYKKRSVVPVAMNHLTITSIMNAQSHDGSFNFELMSLGRDPAQAVAMIQSHVLSSCSPEFRPAEPSSPSPWSRILAITVVTLVVLKRDFVQYEALWALIDIKGRAYVSTVAAGAELVADDLFARAEAALEDQKISDESLDGGNDNNTQETTSTVLPGTSLGDIEVGSTGKDWVELEEAPY